MVFFGLLLLDLVFTAWGHAILQEPPARNAVAGDRNSYCPSCGNGPGICGDGGQWPSSSDYLNFYDGPQRSFIAGQTVKLEVSMIAHHRGHVQISVCDHPINSSTMDAEACLKRWSLQRVPPDELFNDCQVNDLRGDCQPYLESQADRWYLPPASQGMYYTMHFRLPSDLTCERCTLQYRYWTANSCIPAEGYGCYFNHMASLGWDKGAWCGFYCGACPGDGSPSWTPQPDPGCGEEFRNCADIQVLASGSTTPTTTPRSTTTTTMATTSSKQEGGMSCSPTSYGATVESCMKCAIPGYQVWPCNDDRACACTRNESTMISTAGPTNTAPSTSTATEISETTTTLELKVCRAAEGSEIVAATDERCSAACSRVPAGIWPCSSDGPCPNCGNESAKLPFVTSSASRHELLGVVMLMLPSLIAATRMR